MTQSKNKVVKLTVEPEILEIFEKLAAQKGRPLAVVIRQLATSKAFETLLSA